MLLEGGVENNVYQNWDKNGKIFYTDDMGNRITPHNDLNPLKKLGRKLQTGFENLNRYMNDPKTFDERANITLGAITAPIGGSTGLTLKSANVLKPFIGNKLATMTAEGLVGGVTGGAVEGFGRGLIEGKNPLKTMTQDATLGGAFGSLGGLGLGKIGQGLSRRNLLNNPTNENIATNYFNDYIDGLRNTRNAMADFRGLRQGVNNGNANQLYDQIGWHGSPVDFDKFSNDFIGTGAGAQAHGLGHYIALDKSTGQGYQSGLSYKNNAETGQYLGKPIDEIYNETYDLANRTKDRELRQQYYDRTAMLEELMLHKSPEEVLETFSSEDYNLNPETINWFKNEFMPNYQPAGTLYKVSIPDDDVYLREDALFKDQPEKVKDALFNYYQQSLGEYAPRNKEFMNNLTTDDIMNRILTDAKAQNIDKDVIDLQKVRRDILLNNGIKGISYDGGIDGEARVIFNPEDIKILEKNGVPFIAE